MSTTGSPPATDQRQDRTAAAFTGLQIGDALAMPVHWIYDRAALRRDYGHVTGYLAPKEPHPGSIFYRTHWSAPRPELDILGDQRQHYGQYGVHYHRQLKPGEPTLTTKIAREVHASLAENGGYDRADATRRYVDLLTHPHRHRDTYLEECHRAFFTNLGRGRPPEKCAAREKHIGGLVPMLPVALFYRDDPEAARHHAFDQLALTHAGEKMRTAADAVLRILEATLADTPLADAIRHQCRTQQNPHFGFPLERWLDRDDTDIIGPELSTACYVDGAVPAVFYLALKYAEDPEAALVANTNLGGDNVHRGAVLGCLLGAAHGTAAWPAHWRDGLLTAS